MGGGDAFSKSKEEVINLRGGHREVLVRNERLEMVSIWHLHKKFSKNLKMHDKIFFRKSEGLIQRQRKKHAVEETNLYWKSTAKHSN